MGQSAAEAESENNAAKKKPATAEPDRVRPIPELSKLVPPDDATYTLPASRRFVEIG